MIKSRKKIFRFFLKVCNTCHGKVRPLKVHVLLYYTIDHLAMNLLAKLYWYRYALISFMKHNRKHVCTQKL